MVIAKFNGRYVTSGEVESGAVILRVLDVNPRPRKEILLMRSPNDDGEYRTVIHHCLLDIDDNSSSQEMVFSGQVKQKYGEGEFKDDRVKSVMMNSDGPLNQNFTIREFRFPKSAVEAANPTQPALSVFHSFYQFFRQSTSGENFLRLRVIDAANNSKISIFKQVDKTPRFYSGLPELTFAKEISIDFSLIIEAKRMEAKKRRSDNFIKKLASKNPMNNLAGIPSSQEMYKKQLAEDEDLFLAMSSQTKEEKRKKMKKSLKIVKRFTIVMKHKQSCSAKKTK